MVTIRKFQTGNVIIEDHVDIGANSTIDRATLGATRIKRGVKLDNQIQIAHNVEIGENTVIAAQSGVAGSTKIGSNCVIGGQVGVIGHLRVGDRVKFKGSRVLRAISIVILRSMAHLPLTIKIIVNHIFTLNVFLPLLNVLKL